ncbi:hypothetical protein ES708_02728 [subsurface metagenome]
MGYGEWVGSTGTATKPDRVIVNPAWARAQAIRARDIFHRREPGSQRPHEIPLWRTRKGARAEINAFEPKKRVAGSERVREYAGKK